MIGKILALGVALTALALPATAQQTDSLVYDRMVRTTDSVVLMLRHKDRYQVAVYGDAQGVRAVPLDHPRDTAFAVVMRAAAGNLPALLEVYPLRDGRHSLHLLPRTPAATYRVVVRVLGPGGDVPGLAPLFAIGVEGGFSRTTQRDFYGVRIGTGNDYEGRVTACYHNTVTLALGEAVAETIGPGWAFAELRAAPFGQHAWPRRFEFGPVARAGFTGFGTQSVTQFDIGLFARQKLTNPSGSAGLSLMLEAYYNTTGYDEGTSPSAPTTNDYIVAVTFGWTFH